MLDVVKLALELGAGTGYRERMTADLVAQIGLRANCHSPAPTIFGPEPSLTAVMGHAAYDFVATG